jgi:ribosomal protein L24
MMHLSVGDEVTIRWGRQQGQKGRIIRTQVADVYEVKVADGPILCYSAKGLQKDLVEQVVPESEPLGSR